MDDKDMYIVPLSSEGCSLLYDNGIVNSNQFAISLFSTQIDNHLQIHCRGI